MKRLRFSLLFLSGAGLLFGCGAQDTGTYSTEQNVGENAAVSQKARWDAPNSPSIMDTYVGGYGYSYMLKDLPMSGKLSQRPWSGGYWPTHEGGITYRWNMPANYPEERYGYDILRRSELQNYDLRALSPSEKFDLLLGRYNFPYTRKERKRTRIMRTVPGNPRYVPGFKIPRWEGLCHAWAPATLSFREPRPVKVKNRDGLVIPFGSSDIKALLTFFLHHREGRTRFLGKRCEFDLDDLTQRYRRGEISRSYYYEQRRACEDTNAGAFHVVLTNQIARANCKTNLHILFCKYN